MVFELDKRFQVRLCAVACFLALAQSACAPVAIADGERRQALAGTTEQVILPTLSELRERCSALSAGLDELAADPASSDLEELRELYLDARGPLKEAEAFGFGPATELRSAGRIDQAPIAPAKIDSELAGDSEMTLDYVRGLGIDRRGLHAVEYLLFPADDGELSDALMADTAEGERRRSFLSFVGQVVSESADELEQAWAPEGGDYARRFSEPGGPDSVATSVQAGLDTLLNESVFLSELVADAKLGKPLGTATGGAIDPEAQESARSGASLADILGNLRGMHHVYVGTRDLTPSPSLSSLVQAKSPSTNRHALEAFADAEAAVRAVPEPLTLALDEDPEAVSTAYEAVKTLKHVLATEVLGTLGASLKFNDNDGD